MRRKLAFVACSLAILVSGVAAPAAGAAKHHKACSLVHYGPLCISLG